METRATLIELPNAMEDEKAHSLIGPGAAAELSLNAPELFHNRELSLLAFQDRVLDEAKDAANPILERVNFLSIVSSNLDEFFMVRVAVLKQKLAAQTVEVSQDGRTISEQLDAIGAHVTRLLDEQYCCLREGLLPALANAGLRILDYDELSDPEREAVDAYFRDTIMPVLTPLGFDPGRPFPHISNL